MPRAPKRYQQARPPKKDDRPSAAARGYDAAWRKVRAAYLMSHPLCVALVRGGTCDRPAKHVDHHVALEKGGTNDESNLRAYCASCHSRKTCAVDGAWGRPKVDIGGG